MSDKPEVELKVGIDAQKAFEDLLKRVDSGESKLFGFGSVGLGEDEGEEIISVRLKDYDTPDARIDFAPGMAIDLLDSEGMRVLIDGLKDLIPQLEQEFSRLEEEERMFEFMDRLEKDD